MYHYRNNEGFAYIFVNVQISSDRPWSVEASPGTKISEPDLAA